VSARWPRNAAKQQTHHHNVPPSRLFDEEGDTSVSRRDARQARRVSSRGSAAKATNGPCVASCKPRLGTHPSQTQLAL